MKIIPILKEKNIQSKLTNTLKKFSKYFQRTMSIYYKANKILL